MVIWSIPSSLSETSVKIQIDLCCISLNMGQWLNTRYLLHLGSGIFGSTVSVPLTYVSIGIFIFFLNLNRKQCLIYSHKPQPFKVFKTLFRLLEEEITACGLSSVFHIKSRIKIEATIKCLWNNSIQIADCFTISDPWFNVVLPQILTVFAGHKTWTDLWRSVRQAKRTPRRGVTWGNLSSSLARAAS